MLYSMTGFGRAEAQIEGRHTIIEIKSLNGKQFELNTRLPSSLRPYESEIRKRLQSSFLRGSLDFHLSMKQDGLSRPMALNTEAARFYYQSIQQLSESLHIPLDEKAVLPLLMGLPDVIAPEQEVFPESSWKELLALIDLAITQLNQHRQQEGAILEQDLLSRIENLRRLLSEIEPLESLREERVRQRISQALEDKVGKEQVDENRFEQEMIYYLEKTDFSEEKTRLALHCDYFVKTIEEEGMAKGKVLGFILQEIGREINTMGSKANQAEIQQRVIQMKDELEKAKEQVLNIL